MLARTVRGPYQPGERGAHPVERNRERGLENSYASATPASDGESVFVTFQDGGEAVAVAREFRPEKIILLGSGA